MPCDRCSECLNNDERFCRYCGDKLISDTDRCHRCSECRERGLTFCSYCGNRLVPEESGGVKAVRIMGLVAAVMLTAILLFETVIMFWGIGQVLPNIGSYTTSLIIVVPVIIKLVPLTGIAIEIYYILLVIAAAVCIGATLWKAYKPSLALFKKDEKSITGTALFEVCVLFGVTYVINIIMVLVFNPSDPIEFDYTWQAMFELLEAPVWEELITRSLYIGIPMMIVVLIKKNKELPVWHYVIGGWKKFDLWTVIFILIASFMFAGAHLSGGWGAWKFIPTFIFGMMAGYLFVKYGLYASITLHFLTDYLQAEMWLTGSSTMIFTALILVLAMLLCIPYVWVYGKNLFCFIKNKSWNSK